MARKAPSSPWRSRRPASFRCLPWLRAALLWTLAYAVIMMLRAVWGGGSAGPLLVLWWASAQIGLGLAVGCLYRYQPGAWRWGAVAALLVAAGLLTLAAPPGILLPALQALGLTGFSLVLYDLGKLTGRNLQAPGGVIFLAVVASYLLNTQLTAFIGLALLALGTTLALRQLL
ncbi:MAG: hypothetical protein GXO37_03595 [Chloroflexi bacterium]|nr:hypothetical protein [Chloroflexota bacterium]